MSARIVFAAALLVAGCYNPTIADGQFSCASDGACPSGFSCACGVCHPAGAAVTCDMASSSGGNDLAGGKHDLGGASPCSNGGMRSMGDPGDPDVALCPAAWTEAGLTGTDTPCNRQPGANGKKGTTNCSAADNCAAGWHLCTGEPELINKGFTAANCNSVASQSAFWGTQQIGGPAMNDMGMPTGAPICSASSTPHSIFGCGGFGMGSSCSILNKTLNSMPGSDTCATSAAPWSCPASMGHFEITVVTKSSTSGGGVICCKD